MMLWSQNVLPFIGMQVLWCTSMAQGPLALDSTFRCPFHDWYVNSALALNDGNVLLSGRIRLPSEFEQKTLVLVGPSGERVETFYNSGLGGGRITAWNDRYYVATTQTVRRILPSGHLDPDFAEMNSDPTFGSLQGGDYHVYPDGRVLLTGLHQIHEPDGTSDFYSLIWFTDSGWVDHGIAPRQSNAPISRIKEEVDGQFICFYSGTEYEGQQTNGRIFRIHADGTLDTTLQSRVGGRAYGFLPLSDGRFYAAGSFSKAGVPGTIRLARFLPNGDLDPTFNHLLQFDLGEIPDPGSGGLPSRVQQWRNDEILVMGTFQYVEGEPRNGICVFDGQGVLQEEFAGCGVGPYTYEGFTYGGVSGYLETSDNMAYIWGAYHGYNDGTTNDTLQRFVTRLYGPDWPTAVLEQASTMAFTVYPNPAQGQVAVKLQRPNTSTRLVLRDATGRIVLEQRGHTYETRLEVGKLTTGCYLVEVYEHDERIGSEKLILQP